MTRPGLQKISLKKQIKMEKLLNETECSVIAVTSGKGGVGKSIATVNIAEMLTFMGYSVAVIDADVGLSNTATLLNEQLTFTIDDWIKGDCYLEDLPHDLEPFTLITASNTPGISSAETVQLMSAMDQVVNYLITYNDFIFIDTPAGAGEITLWSLDQADVGLLILVDEPTAVSDAYRLCKYIYSIAPDYPFANIVNFAANEKSAYSTNQRFNNILEYFLNQKTEHFGFLPSSDEIKELVTQQHTLLQQKSKLTELENAFLQIGQNIAKYFDKDKGQKTKLKQLM